MNSASHSAACATKPPLIFVCYAHANWRWKDRINKHLMVLGAAAVFSDETIPPGEEWEKIIGSALRAASIALLLITPDFFASDYIRNIEIPILKRRWRQREVRVIPVLCEPAPINHHPWLSRLQAHPKDKPLSKMKAPSQQQEALNELIDKISPRFRVNPSERPNRDEPEEERRWSTWRLPSPVEGVFVNRREQLRSLNRAYRSKEISVVSLITEGGMGKTALAMRWFQEAAKKKWFKPSHVYAFSFFAQGSASDRAAAGMDTFFEEALKHFGASDPISRDSTRNGAALAAAINRHESVLILDGVEPLQIAEAANCGQFKDPGMRTLLLELAGKMNGLCIITSRERLADLEGQIGATQIPVEQFPETIGSRLLRELGVRSGGDSDLQFIAKKMKGHALSLTLVGTYLRDNSGGSVLSQARQLLSKGGISRIPLQRSSAALNAVIEGYLQHFKNQPALCLALLSGLYDRPIEPSSLETLRNDEGFMKKLAALCGNPDLSARSWQSAIQRLLEARLLFKTANGGREELGAHPLIGEFFGEAFRQMDKELWRAGHKILYRHFADVAPPKPKTRVEMEPLYAAMTHACLAGLHSEAFEEVYLQRIRQEKPDEAKKKFERSNGHFNVKKLGMVSSDLAVLAHYIEPGWSSAQFLPDKEDQAFVLLYAGLDLRLAGRLAEAEQSFKASVKLYEDLRDPIGATTALRHLSQLYSIWGKLEQGLAEAENAVRWAREEGVGWKELVSALATLGNVRHQRWEMEEAEICFDKAIALQALHGPQKLLVMLPGYRYREFLLDKGDVGQVIQEATTSSEQNLDGEDLYGRFLNLLILGKAQVVAAKTPGELADAGTTLDQALAGLREADQKHSIAAALLAVCGASLYRDERQLEVDFAKAEACLGEAFQIILDGEMRLLEADAYLESAKLHLKRGEPREAEASLAKTRRLVNELGYRRRNKVLSDLENWCANEPRSGRNVSTASKNLELIAMDIVEIVVSSGISCPKDWAKEIVARKLQVQLAADWLTERRSGDQTVVVVEGDRRVLARMMESLMKAAGKRWIDPAIMEIRFATLGKWLRVVSS